MFKIINNDQVQAMHVTFEPGNCTRYDILVAYIPEQLISVTDLNNKNVVLFNPVCATRAEIEIRLGEHGYGRSDARALAIQLEQTFSELG